MCVVTLTVLTGVGLWALAAAFKSAANGRNAVSAANDDRTAAGTPGPAEGATGLSPDAADPRAQPAPVSG